MHLDQMLDQMEADARSRNSGRRRGAKEPLEQLLLLVFGNADAFIMYRNHDIVAVAEVGADPD